MTHHGALKLAALAVALMVLDQVPGWNLAAIETAEAGGMTMKRDEPLPFAKGKIFHDLDSYLAHLTVLGARDIPFYEPMSDGRYKLVTPFVRDPNIKRVFTRQELLQKYGFKN